MTRTIRPNRYSIGPDEEVVRTAELERLQRKERAHDDYLAALQEMYRRRVRMSAGVPGVTPDYRAGWLDCLTEWGAAIVAASRRRA
jgi:hypothetical protein